MKISLINELNVGAIAAAASRMRQQQAQPAKAPVQAEAGRGETRREVRSSEEQYVRAMEKIKKIIGGKGPQALEDIARAVGFKPGAIQMVFNAFGIKPDASGKYAVA